MYRDEGVQKRSGGGVERRRTVPLWGPLTLVVVVAVGSLLVMQVQTLPDPLPESAMGPLPPRGTAIDEELADAGEELFRINCASCHRYDAGQATGVGPSLMGSTRRRSFEWIRGMVLEPDSMHRDDPVARELLLRWRVPMRDVGLDDPSFRAVLEYMRLRDRPPEAGAAPRRYGPAPLPRDSTGAFAAGQRRAGVVDTVGDGAAEAAAGRRALVDTVGGSRLDPDADTTTLPPDTLRRRR